MAPLQAGFFRVILIAGMNVLFFAIDSDNYPNAFIFAVPQNSGGSSAR